MTQHYIAVLKPLRGGGWQAHFPDFAGCRADGTLVEMAIERSKMEVRTVLDRLVAAGEPIPGASSYQQVRANEQWARERGIEWSTAVICMIEIGAVGTS